MAKKVDITVDYTTITKYNQWYFGKYPRRRKDPIDRPIPLSLNQWMAMPRFKANGIKQKWKEFSIWLADYHGVSGMEMGDVRMNFHCCFPRRGRRDFDNLVLAPKFINDGLVEAGVFSDDNSDMVRISFEDITYEKGVMRLHIEILYSECKNLPVSSTAHQDNLASGIPGVIKGIQGDL